MTQLNAAVLHRLLQSPEPSVRWKALVEGQGVPRSVPEVVRLEEEIRGSARVRALLQRVGGGRFQNFRGAYDKWQGAHWALLTLADLGYPRGAAELTLLFEDVLRTWLAPRYLSDREVTRKEDAYADRNSIPVMQGRHRTCASQQANALYALLTLGVEDERVHQLAERLLAWQWPDGGWNCDKDPAAHTSTFVHSLWCLRALGVYTRRFHDVKAHRAVERAAEFFLCRQLVFSRRTGQPVRAEFLKLHYPRYWHYDVLGALKVFAELDLTADPRLKRPLDLLLQKRLPDGGWPAEAKYYTKVGPDYALGTDYVDWGGTSTKNMNEWLTADALFVLRKFKSGPK